MKKLYILFLFVGFNLLFSCVSVSLNDEILKDVVVDFLLEHEEGIRERIEYEKINNIIVYINREYELVSIKDRPPMEGEAIELLIYPDLDIYILYYDNSYFDNEFSPPPSKLFYVEGYPVMLFDKNIPPMDKKYIPKHLYKNEIRSTGGDEWLVAINKHTHKYIVIRNSYMKGKETIEEVNKFSCGKQKIIYKNWNELPK